MMNPTQTQAWHKLKQLYLQTKEKTILDRFSQDPNRLQNMHVRWQSFLFDYSKNHLDKQTVELLVSLAEQCSLKAAIRDLFSGHFLNTTEQRLVLHTALRSMHGESIFVDQENIIPKIKQVRERMKAFSEKVLTGQYTGFTGKAITDVVHVGIGGSALGPAMVTRALDVYKTHLKVHFVSNIDASALVPLLELLNPETTLVIVASKTFKTEETLLNATAISDWFISKTEGGEAWKHHFFGVTLDSAYGIAKSFGILEENLFPMWSWVGGRFSVWGCVGLTVSLALGYSHFEALCRGAYQMDLHFKETDFSNNIPVLMALIGIWNVNFLNYSTHAVVTYDAYLNLWIDYLQQLNMESNGKSVDRDQKEVTYATSPILWGQVGTDGQHSFFQLLHQGTQTSPVDFMVFKEPIYHMGDHHKRLMSHCFAQAQALAFGSALTQTVEKDPSKEDPFVLHKLFKGNKPSNMLVVDKLTPYNLGALMALYEHKVFVQGVIWNINSFDQWGVCLGKEIAQRICKSFGDNYSILDKLPFKQSITSI